MDNPIFVQVVNSFDDFEEVLQLCFIEQRLFLEELNQVSVFEILSNHEDKIGVLEDLKQVEDGMMIADSIEHGNFFLNLGQRVFALHIRFRDDFQGHGHSCEELGLKVDLPKQPFTIFCLIL